MEKTMNTRMEIISSFYNRVDEDSRLQRSRHGQLEYAVTMHYIHRFCNPGARILEVGAGTGRYSIALAKEGMNVTALELVNGNLAILRKNSEGIHNIHSCQGDATDLSRFEDQTFDMTLVLGPLYHLYEAEDVQRAIDEAVRVTKENGVILFAFLSVFGIMYANYLQGNWAAGQEENFTEDFRVRHFKEQLFTGYDVKDFELLFEGKPVRWITTTGTDGIVESIEGRSDFTITDEDFPAFVD